LIGGFESGLPDSFFCPKVFVLVANGDEQYSLGLSERSERNPRKIFQKNSDAEGVEQICVVPVRRFQRRRIFFDMT
jgi:hypothetical protein